jgi:hypothetical protein
MPEGRRNRDSLRISESRQIFAEIAAGQIKSDHLFNLNGGYVPLHVTH